MFISHPSYLRLPPVLATVVHLGALSPCREGGLRRTVTDA